MSKIQSLNIPTKGVAKNLSVYVLKFNMDDKSATFYYVLSDEDNNTLLEGNLDMNEQDFNAWGADNFYCIQWAATTLNLTLL
jgi:hypothetical protein